MPKTFYTLVATSDAFAYEFVSWKNGIEVNVTLPPSYRNPDMAFEHADEAGDHTGGKHGHGVCSQSSAIAANILACRS